MSILYLHSVFPSHFIGSNKTLRKLRPGKGYNSTATKNIISFKCITNSTWQIQPPGYFLKVHQSSDVGTTLTALKNVDGAQMAWQERVLLM